MQKIYYEIWKTRGETRNNKDVYPGCTAQPGTDCFDTEAPERIGKFETLEEAKAELKKYNSSARYVGTFAFDAWEVEEYGVFEVVYEVDENGEEEQDYDYSNDLYAVAEFNDSESNIKEVLGMTLADFNKGC